MIQWVSDPGEKTLMYSPVGLRLVDDFTTRSALGKLRAALEIQDSQGNYHPTDIEAVVTPSSFLIYPGLGLTRDPTTAPQRQYRVAVDADYYFPLYSATPGGTPAGIVFVAPPYDTATPPGQPPLVADLVLLPGPAYPFESVYPVVRGVVRDAGGAPVPRARVWVSQTERVIAGDRGEYAIAVRYVQPIATIHADDQNRVGFVNVDVTDPNSRDVSQTITIQ